MTRPIFRTSAEYEAWQEGLSYADYFLSTQVGAVETVRSARNKYRKWCIALKKNVSKRRSKRRKIICGV